MKQCRGHILLQQAACSRSLADYEKAASRLNGARQFAVSSDSKISLHIAEAEYLLADALRRLATHRVYCVLPESTISLPSLQSGNDGAMVEEHPPTAAKAPVSRKTKAPPTKGARPRAQKTSDGFQTLLSKAGECLENVLSTANTLGSTLDSHTACGLMGQICILSHATATGSSLPGSQSPAGVNGK